MKHIKTHTRNKYYYPNDLFSLDSRNIHQTYKYIYFFFAKKGKEIVVFFLYARTERGDIYTVLCAR